jgi:RecB family exonuclease
MALTAVLTALTNPVTQSAAFALIDIASSVMRLAQDLDNPELTDKEREERWSDIAKMMLVADKKLSTSLRRHPAWRDENGALPPVS